MKRKPVIGVMGGSKATETVRAQARHLGHLIAEQGWVLLNGGRNRGVMAASAAGAREAINQGADSLVVGIIRETTTTRATQDLDVAIVTGMGDARNVINVLSSDVVVACPGGLGTMSEIVLALKQGKHVILLGFDVDPGVRTAAHRDRLIRVETPEEAVDQVSAVLAEIGR